MGIETINEELDANVRAAVSYWHSMIEDRTSKALEAYHRDEVADFLLWAELILGNSTSLTIKLNEDQPKKRQMELAIREGIEQLQALLVSMREEMTW